MTVSECAMCKEDTEETYWSYKYKVFMCSICMRQYNPPYMTLMKFLQGSYNMIWNLECGSYESFNKVEEITDCGWFIRSTQETIYKQNPKVCANVYHLEYFGSVACGRCEDYPYFDGGACLPSICEKMTTRKKQSEIQYPPERSRYSKWMKL